MPPQAPPSPAPASLSHFVIFNPNLKPPVSHSHPEDKDTDLEDDLREAAQILFYTSRGVGGVSRDKMLRQVGLAKGLMGFSDMVTKEKSDDFYAIHSQKSRLLIWSPEKDFYMYINITLSTQSHSKMSTTGSSSPIPSNVGEPATAQGLLDDLLIDVLRRGYEDFRLLHGPFSLLIPPSPSLSSLLDKFWTRFAFSFESIYLSQAIGSPDILDNWLSAFIDPSDHIAESSKQALDRFRRESNLPEASETGVIGRDGPLALDAPSVDEAILRFLVHLVQASLPPPATADLASVKIDTRQSLGFGLGRRKRDDGRRSSWASFGSAAAGWVPGLSVPSRSSTPSTVVPDNAKAAAVNSTNGSVPVAMTEGRGRWPSLGLGGLSQAMGNISDAMGSMGTNFGLGTSPQTLVNTPSPPAHRVNRNDETGAYDGVSADSVSAVGDGAIANVEQTPVAITDLESAVLTETEVEVTWESRSAWLRAHEGDNWAKRRVQWVLRDTILVFVLWPPDTNSSSLYLSSQASLNLLAAISEMSEPSRPSIDQSPLSTPTAIPNSILYLHPDGNAQTVDRKGPEMDAASAQNLAEVRASLHKDPSLVEVYARTASSRFVVAKRDLVSSPDARELLMLVGRKDASLTDAEQAVRGFGRQHPEFVI